MKRSRTYLIGSMAAMLLLTASQARAGLIDWKYNWEPGALAVSGDGGDGKITFSDQPLGNATGSSDVVATNIRTISSAPPGAPNTLITNGAYSLTLSITDVVSGKSGALLFTGKLGGTFSSSNSNVTNMFTGLTTQMLTLGGHTFTVVIGPYTPPGPPTASNAGSISAHVTVDSIHTQGVPEPSTMGLALFGLTTFGANWWRKRRLAA
jgi:hypothetical protein